MKDYLNDARFMFVQEGCRGFILCLFINLIIAFYYYYCYFILFYYCSQSIYKLDRIT